MAGAACGLGLAGLRGAAQDADRLDPRLEGRDLEVVAVVAAMPQRGELGLRLRLEVEAARLDGQAVRVPQQALVTWYARAASAAEEGAALPAPQWPRAGERWRLTLRLKAPHGTLNPHGFDYELWLWEQGIGATGYVRARPGASAPQRLSAGSAWWPHPVERLREAVRDAITASAADARSAGVLAALVVGDQAAIERADWEVFRKTGVAHLMSISGLHVTMFAWLAGACIAWLWRASARWTPPGRRALPLWWPAPFAGWLGGLFCAAAYALFSGMGLPAQRTLCMLACFTLLRLSGRRWPARITWMLAFAVVLAFDPWGLMQPGFWLSFVAVGVLFATGAAPQATPTEPVPGESAPPQAAWRVRLAALARPLVSLLREQFIVTAALAPLTLALFQQVSLVGLLANLVAIPWVTLVVTPLAMAGVLLPVVWDLAGWATAGLTAGLRELAQWPWATLSMPAAPLALSVLALSGAVLAVMRLPWPVRFAGLLMTLPMLLWQPARPQPGQFELMAVDIGQGNSLIVRTARHSLLYDAGPRYASDSDAGQRVLVPLLRALGEAPDRLVISHRDSDHSGGAAAVLAAHPDADWLSSVEPAHELQAIRPAMRCQAGQRWEWDGVRFEVLHPDLADYATPRRPNELSCVLKVSGASRAALLTGDLEMPQERRLVESTPGALRADVLLVPHHGSRTSSSPAFLDAVQPSLAIVQAGYRNRFGHPATDVMQRYTLRGIRVLGSPACGALLWQSAAPDTPVCWRQAGRRYWHHALPP